MDLFFQILNTISAFDGVKADKVILVTQTVTSTGDSGLGIEPTYSQTETEINAHIAPLSTRLFALINVQELDADYLMITNTNIDDYETALVKWNDVEYSILEKRTPKLLVYQTAYVYSLKRLKGQFADS